MAQKSSKNSQQVSNSRQTKGEGSTFQRKDGRWIAQVTLEDGTQKQFYAKTEKEAKTKLRTALAEAEKGSILPDRDQLLSQYLEHWLEQIERHSLKTSSYLRYRSILNTHLLPGLGHIQMRKLKAEHLDQFYTKKLRAGMAPKTIHLVHGVLHKALETAVKRRHIIHNVCKDVTLPRVETHEIHALTREQAFHLLETARGHRLEAIIVLALTTGMRRGELLALRWDDINWNEGSLQVRRSVNRFGAGHGYVVSEPKTNSSRRHIILPSFVLETLKQHRQNQEIQRRTCGAQWHDQNLVFANNNGDFFHPNHLRDAFIKLLEDAKLPYMRFHDLRHSSATLLLSMGVHPKVVQEILGHSDISMTLDIYSHALPTLQKEAMQKFHDLFQPSPLSNTADENMPSDTAPQKESD